MKPVITAFECSPDEGQGLARDMRVRWALEEVGQDYDAELLSFEEMKQPGYLARQPFGQIPAYRERDLDLFESGAIVLHLAETRPGLLPAEPDARARAIMWMFAAVATMEQPAVNLEEWEFFEQDKPWGAARGAEVKKRLLDRLERLSARLGDSDWLDGDFSAGDLMMVEVLLRIEGSEVLKGFPNLVAYTDRARDRPAFKRAFAAQKAVFEESSSRD